MPSGPLVMLVRLFMSEKKSSICRVWPQ